MARGATLRSLIDKVRSTARLSTNPSRGIDNRQDIVGRINSYYEFFWDDGNFEFSKIRREDSQKPLQAGSRYYDIPAEMDLDYAVEAWVKWGSEWMKLHYGITREHYTICDSDAGITQDPPERWDRRDDRQFEIWPMPASDGLLVGFDGRRKIAPLVDDGDRCELDDWLIVFHVAADILAANDQKDAKIKMAFASARYSTLKRQARDRSVCQVGLGSEVGNGQLEPQEGYPRIIVAR